MYENSTTQNDWKTQHNNYIAETIISLGPEICNEYMQRNYTERHSHSKIATALGTALGNPSAWVHDAFYTSMYKARELVREDKISQEVKSKLEVTLGSYNWVVANQKS
jgi:hypothetical protein